MAITGFYGYAPIFEFWSNHNVVLLCFNKNKTKIALKWRKDLRERSVKA